MKNIYLFLALFFIIPSTMGANFDESRQEATITITNDLLTAKSTLKHKADKWQVEHIKPIKKGITKLQFIPFNGTSVKVIITKY